MIVLDTHAWIWWASDPGLLSRNARRAIDAADVLGVAAVSCFEVAFLGHRRRIELNRSPRVWVSQALGLERVAALPLTPEVAVRAATLDRAAPDDPFDRIVYATALDVDAQLVTKDEALRRYDRARTIW